MSREGGKTSVIFKTGNYQIDYVDVDFVRYFGQKYPSLCTNVRTLVCRNQKYPWSAQNIQGFLQRKQGASPTEKLVCLYDALSFIEVNEFLIFVPQPFLKLTAAPHKHKPDIIPQTAVTDRNDSPTLELTESRISPPCQKPIRIPHTGRRYPRRACADLLGSWSLKTRIAPLLSKSNQKTGRKF